MIELCTLTGVDELISSQEMESISRDFNFVEWGVLYSPNLSGSGEQNRYPSLKKILSIFECANPCQNLSLHVCGRGIYEMMNPKATVLQKIIRIIKDNNWRVQFNLNQKRFTNDKDLFENFKEYLHENFSSTEFITQFNASTVSLCDFFASFDSHVWLFDSSGGRGVPPDEWLPPLPGKRCGYAGGLGLNNIKNEIFKIKSVTHGSPIWVDMESSLRDQDDNFDLFRCNDILEEIALHVEF
jgi:phosphoribosylanthranilate isomerase